MPSRAEARRAWLHLPAGDGDAQEISGARGTGASML